MKLIYSFCQKKLSMYLNGVLANKKTIKNKTVITLMAKPAYITTLDSVAVRLGVDKIAATKGKVTKYAKPVMAGRMFPTVYPFCNVRKNSTAKYAAKTNKAHINGLTHAVLNRNKTAGIAAASKTTINTDQRENPLNVSMEDVPNTTQ